MNLLGQSLWWLVPFALLMLLMVHAMMEFTVSLLVRPSGAGRKPLPAGQLRRLLAAYGAGRPYPLVEGKDCDLEIRWQPGGAPRPGHRGITKGASSGHLRLLLDEQRHEVRIHEVTRSYFFFLGLAGWLPRLQAYAGVQSGPPGQAITQELGRITQRAGWRLRPVLWWFEATHNGVRRLEALTPLPLRRWPARRLWGLAYPLTYALGIGYLVLMLGPLEGRDWWLLLGVSACWWGVWGFLAWMLCGFPAFWRRRRG